MTNELPELPEDLRQAIASTAPTSQELMQWEEMIHDYARAAVEQATADGGYNRQRFEIAKRIDEAMEESKP